MPSVGDRFVAACRWAARVMRADPDAASEKAETRLRQIAAKLEEARDALPAVAAGRVLRRQAARVTRLERRAEAARKALESPSLRAALDLAGLAVTPHEIRALASLAAVVAAAVALGVFLGSIPLLRGVPFVAVPAIAAAPLLAYAVVLGHPETVAKRARLASLARSPEAVNYLAMSLSVRPSLERAVAFAAEHSEGPIAARMRRVLWDVHMRSRTRIEDAFTALADEWGAWNGELKRALYVIAHAVREGSRDGMDRALDRARSIVYDGARRRLQDYAAGLRGPTTALFALGVLLPLILGSMLPLLSLGGMSPTSIAVATPPPGDPILWILLLDVAFPAVTFALAHHVSSGRPGLAAPPTPRRRSLRPFAPFAVAPVAVIAALSVPHPLAPVLGLGGILLPLAVALHAATREAQRERKRTEELEREFPDALFQLGSRLGEGRGLEDAFLFVGDGLGRTAAGEVFARIARSLRLGGGTVEEVLFGPRGALRDLPSRTVRATLKMVVDVAAKDPETAGRATLEMSGHLRDLQGVERDLRAELRPTIDAMRATATFFAPIVLGVSGALYGLLSEAFATIASLPMPPSTFHLAVAVYLALATGGILHFTTRLESGGDPVAFQAGLARTLPVGYGVYVVTLALAQLAL